MAAAAAAATTMRAAVDCLPHITTPRHATPLHCCAARTKQYFHSLLHRRLDDILAVAQPQQRVVLALDGPAPLAKLLEQRWVSVGGWVDGWMCISLRLGSADAEQETWSHRASLLA